MTSPNEIGARLQLSGRAEYVSDAHKASEATENIGRAAKKGATEAEASSKKFATITSRAKRAGVQTSEALGAAGRSGGRRLGEGIRGGVRSSEGAIHEAGREAGEGFGSRFRESAGEFVKTFAGPFLAFLGIEKIHEVATEAFGEARALSKAQSQTNAVLKSTGSIADVSKKEVGELAEHLALVGHTTKSAGQGALNMLLSFSRVRNEVGKGNDIFNQASEAAADVSARFGTKLPAAMRLVGRALSNPAKAAGALSRIIGGPLTTSQVKYIKALVQSNRTLDAQKYILGLVHKAVGGAAEASVRPTDRLRVAWEEFTTGIAQKVIPWFGKLATFAVDKVLPAVEELYHSVVEHLTPYFKAFGKWMQTTGIPALRLLWKWFVIVAKQGASWGMSILKVILPPIKSLVKWFGSHLLPMLHGFGDWISKHATLVKSFAVGILAIVGAYKAWVIVTKVWKGITEAATKVQAAFNFVMEMNPFLRIALLIIGIGAALIYAYKHSKTFRDIVNAVFRFVKRVIGDVVDWVVPKVESIWHIFQTVIGFISRHWRGILEIITGPIGVAVVWIIDHFDTVKKVFKTVAHAIGTVFKTVFGWIKTAYDNTIGPIVDAVEAAAGFFGIGGDATKPDGSGYQINPNLGKINTGDLSKLNGVDLSGLGKLGDISGLGAKPKKTGHNANGTDRWKGGLSWVGERGPELLNIPERSQVVNNTSIKQMVNPPKESISHTNPSARDTQPVTVHSHLYLDGKEVLSSVKTHVRNEEANYE